jgi:Polyketide cyclase / dehydrase and lipid transport
MMRKWNALVLYAAAALALPFAAPAQAEVTHVSDQGFAVLHVVKINAAPDKVWATLIAPQSFWSSSHSWSGDAANMYLDPQAGGCFCERIPAKNVVGGSLNSVEHMRVIYSERPRVLRMSGALGPLQSEGVVGTMNVAMEADGDGTKISISYVVGGFMRMKPQDIAPAVDTVIGEQLLRLKARAEGRDPAAIVWPAKKADAAKVEAAPPVPKEGAKPPKPVADAPKNAATPSPKADTPKVEPAKPAAPVKAAPKPAVTEPKLPLSERLKDVETPVSDAAPAPDAKPVDSAASPKKKPIVEEAPKKKRATVPPGTR